MITLCIAINQLHPQAAATGCQIYLEPSDKLSNLACVTIQTRSEVSDATVWLSCSFCCVQLCSAGISGLVGERFEKINVQLILIAVFSSTLS